jgi:hypothetical protein
MRPETSEVPNRRRVLVLSGIAIALALLVGILIGRSLAPEEDVAPPQTAPPASTPEETDYALTEEGAVEAATEYSKIMASPSADTAAYLNAVSQIAAPEWRERARELAENTISFVEERYGAGGDLEFNPIRYRLRSYSSDEATVDIWGVVLGSGPHVAGIEESWITGTVTLVSIGGEWKLSGQTSKGGPTPELLQTDEDASANLILNQFREYSDAAKL